MFVCVCVRTHVGKQAADGLNVGSSKHVAELTDHGQTQGVNSDSPFACQSHTPTNQDMMWTYYLKTHRHTDNTFTGCVEKSSLEAR